MLQFYRDKIRAEVEGRSYTPPAPSASNSSSSRPPVASTAGRSARVASNSNNDSWDDWGAKPSNVKVLPLIPDKYSWRLPACRSSWLQALMHWHRIWQYIANQDSIGLSPKLCHLMSSAALFQCRVMQAVSRQPGVVLPIISLRALLCHFLPCCFWYCAWSLPDACCLSDKDDCISLPSPTVSLRAFV